MTLTLPQANVQYPKAQGYGARIGNLYLRLAPDNELDLRVYTDDSLAQRQDDRGSFYENVLDLGYAWARTDWSGGEGIDWDPPDRVFLDAERDLLSVRYWDSELLDVSVGEPGQPYTLDVTKGFQLWGGSMTAPADLSASETELFIADGSTVAWFDDFADTTPNGSDILPAAVVAIAAAPNGECLAVLSDGSVSGRPVGAAAFTDGLYTGAGTRDAVGVWYVKGRFLVAFDDIDTNKAVYELAEVTSSDGWVSNWTETVIDTADGPFWSITDSGPAIVAACGDGTIRTYTPYLDGSTPAAVGQLIPRGRKEMPSDEVPFLVGDIEDLLLILTTSIDPTDRQVRCYQAEVLDARFDYSVGGRQLKRTWNDASDIPDVTRAMASSRDALFFTIQESDGTNWLWRFDAVTTGLSRHRNTGTSATSALLVVNTLLGFRTTGNEIYYDATTYVDSGYIITPNITFGLNTPINWVAVVIEARNLGQGAQVEVYRSTDPEAITDPNHSTWVLMSRLTSNLQSGTEWTLANIQSRTLAMMLRVYANDTNTVSAQVTRLAIRGLPSHRDIILDMPVNVSDLIEVHGRQPLRIPDWGDQIYTELLELSGAHVEAEVFDPPLLIRGIVDAVMAPVSWISPRGASSRRCLVRIRGNRITAEQGSNITGNSLTGLGLTGISTTGLGGVGPP